MAAKTTDEIATMLKGIRFRHRMFGGIDEDDVWRVMDKFQQEYTAVLDAQAERYGALLEDRDRKIVYLEGRLNNQDGPDREGPGHEQSE